VIRYYKTYFGPRDTQDWSRFVLLQLDSIEPFSAEALICQAGNAISDVLIAEGADPLLYRYGDPQPITAQEYDLHERSTPSTSHPRTREVL